MIVTEETKTAIAKIENLLPAERLHGDEPMSRHTSFRIGGPAACLAVAGDERELAGILGIMSESGAEYMLIGNGSNLLVADEGYPGVIIKLGGEFEGISVDENDDTLVHVGAAALMSKTSAFVTERGLSGFEFASGIPGSIGGAVFMNAGAYGGEIKDICESVRVMPLCHSDTHNNYKSDNQNTCHSERSEESDKRSFASLRMTDSVVVTGDVVKTAGVGMTISNEEMEFGYRSSRVQAGDMVVLSADFRLTRDEPEAIASRVAELAAKRNSKQPVNYPSAGSTFKRPVGGYAAALIEEAGLKGYRVGGAAVSEKHSGFVINEGGATAEDVLAVMRHVRERVYENSGIMLEPEVRLINCEL